MITLQIKDQTVGASLNELRDITARELGPDKPEALVIDIYTCLAAILRRAPEEGEKLETPVAITQDLIRAQVDLLQLCAIYDVNIEAVIACKIAFLKKLKEVKENEHASAKKY